MKNLFLLAGASAVIALAGCSKKNDDAAIINPQDKSILIIGSVNNAAEIILGQLAADSSQTPAIKEFGAMMVSDHTNADAGLNSIASKYGVTVPGTIDPDHEDLRKKLLTLKGREFDSLYIHSQVADHLDAVIQFQTAHDLGNNSELATYIVNTLPTLQQHLQEAQALAQDY
jgi:putative membrane protein